MQFLSLVSVILKPHGLFVLTTCIGEIADLAEIAATPAIIEGCVKGIEKEGKAEFKVFGKKHTLDINKPTEKSGDRPAKSSHSSASTSSECPRQPNHAKRAKSPCNAEKYETITTKISDEPGTVGTLKCTYSGGKSAGGQACLHYCKSNSYCRPHSTFRWNSR